MDLFNKFNHSAFYFSIHHKNPVTIPTIFKLILIKVLYFNITRKSVTNVLTAMRSLPFSVDLERAP